MIEMTPAARERLDNYLQRLRSELRGARSVVADEVEQSVREHIDIALADAHSPVGATEVIGILDRLGAPERWLADEERPLWRRALERVRSGPEDWRLAYLAFGLFLASIVFLPIGGILLLLPAMLVSRGYVELLRDRGEPLGARRWLVYPPIAVILAFAVGLLIVGPPLPLIAFGLDDRIEPMFDIPRTRAGEMRFLFGMGGVLFGSWWIIAAAFCAAFLRPIRFVFVPLLDGLRRKHFGVLAAIGAVVAAVGATLVYYRH
ncbi:MAG TPA: hypothetical protein VND45_07895 [Thermoanaerobaculia bacterium]|jgi:hypothetical protein|nr:hypothetical protein [Thermoanaerobaculia bacterium]